MRVMTHAQRSALHRWTRPDDDRRTAHGSLAEDAPIELLDGLLLVKEPQASPHRTAVLLVAKALERAFGEGWFVQTQSPIILDERSEPEPDGCGIRGSPPDYVDAHPTRPALVVEVAERGRAPPTPPAPPSPRRPQRSASPSSCRRPGRAPRPDQAKVSTPRPTASVSMSSYARLISAS